ncbi:hypothetical protein M0R45_002331 [Rubus argutus]|uniref:Uncharacterized protein n=1 Tax=Rubus argutus TaxID=59490 RepID=A0AAW1VD65_RUBAR
MAAAFPKHHRTILSLSLPSPPPIHDVDSTSPVQILVHSPSEPIYVNVAKMKLNPHGVDPLFLPCPAIEPWRFRRPSRRRHLCRVVLSPIHTVAISSPAAFFLDVLSGPQTNADPWSPCSSFLHSPHRASSARVAQFCPCPSLSSARHSPHELSLSLPKQKKKN